MTTNDGKEALSEALKAKIIGRHFIMQYYGEVLPKTPSELHRFYNEQSIFCHAEGSLEVEPVSGLASIKEKINELNLVDVTVDLDFGSIDAQLSQSDSIILMVTGCIQFKDSSPRQFVQTVFLCKKKQPNQSDNYYVLNDIFRLLDTIPSVLEAAVEERISKLKIASSHTTTPEVLIEVPPSPVSTSSSHLNEPEPSNHSHSCKDSHESPKSIPREISPRHTPEEMKDQTLAESSWGGAWNSQEETSSWMGQSSVKAEWGTESGPKSPMNIITDEEAPADGWDMQKSSPVVNTDDAPPPPPPAVIQSQSQLPKSSWASVVSKRPSDTPKATTTPQPAPVTPIETEVPTAPVDSQSKPPAPTKAAETVTNSLWVRNIGQNITDQAISEAFEKFGIVTSIYIRRDKNFAFVTFESTKSVDDAMLAKENGEDITIDRRTLKYERKNEVRKDDGNNRKLQRGTQRYKADSYRATKEADGFKFGGKKGGESYGRGKGRNDQQKDNRRQKPVKDALPQQPN